MIERVEVVRGGGSALFGANAVGGTINIITKDPISNSFQVSSMFSCMDGKSWEQYMGGNVSWLQKIILTVLPCMKAIVIVTLMIVMMMVSPNLVN